MTVAWILLAAAIVLEVGATVCLRMAAVGGSKWWYLAVGAGYVVSFGMLSITLRLGFPLGVAYGIWSASGVALTALAGRALFGERLTRLTLIGIGLIIAGVLLVEAGANL